MTDTSTRRRPFPTARTAAVILGLPALGIVAGAVLAASGYVHMGEITRDLAAILAGHPLYGIQSTVGVLVWWSAAVIGLFAASVVHRTGGPSEVGSFLLWSGLLTALLAIDDQFMIHDDLAARYLGLRERDVVATYVILSALVILRFQRLIRRTEWGLLAAALALFAASVAGDLLVQQDLGQLGNAQLADDWRNFIEDGFKLLGIAAWSAYLIRCSFSAVSGQWDPADESTPTMT